MPTPNIIAFPRFKGIIVTLVEHGYGFIATNDQKSPYHFFFHATSLKNVDFPMLYEGDGVYFDTQAHHRGPRAVNVWMVTRRKGL